MVPYPTLLVLLRSNSTKYHFKKFNGKNDVVWLRPVCVLPESAPPIDRQSRPTFSHVLIHFLTDSHPVVTTYPFHSRKCAAA
jgi:hypothetical protein